jgi:hypothetical protein
VLLWNVQGKLEKARALIREGKKRKLSDYKGALGR